MWEMLEIAEKFVLLMGLFHLAWKDWKTKLIHEKDLLLLAGIGVIIKMMLLFVQKESGVLEFFKTEFIIKIPSAMLVGGILFLIAKFTKEKVGFGDAFVFVVTGIFLDSIQNTILLTATLFLAGIAAAICTILKKKGKHDSMAMMPFTLAAYVLFIL